MLLTAGSTDNMARILQEVKKDGRIIDVEQSGDGSYAVKPSLEAPPRTDAPMPIGLLANAINAEGGDVTKSELKSLLGPSLGSEAGADMVEAEIEMFGFDDLLDVSPKTEPLIAHDWETVSKNNPNLPGVVFRVSQCRKCGLTTKNTSNHTKELCGSDSVHEGHGRSLSMLPLPTGPTNSNGLD